LKKKSDTVIITLIVAVYYVNQIAEWIVNQIA